MREENPGQLGSLTDAAGATLAELGASDAIARLWAGDHTLWRSEPTEIADRLGWLTIVPEMLAQLDALRSQCAALIDGVDHVLLMGMGGSSLFPEVLARLTPAHQRPRLHILDTTHPAVVARFGDELSPERTLHIAASKSGTTLETRSHLEWAWERSQNLARFAAITDPGSELDTLAQDRGFAAIWRNRPDIGGRYSGLSYFGLVPGLLTNPGFVDGLLTSASAMTERLRGAPSANPAAQLAAVMAAGVCQGRDKLTFVMPPEVEVFGLWLEQLLAESTGKDGTGVVPVIGEPLARPEDYGDDRLFVRFSCGDDDRDWTRPDDRDRFDELLGAGYPVWTVPYAEVGDLGGQVLLWEVATALCGALLGVHPFDQPDVATAKAATDRVLAEGLPDELSGSHATGPSLSLWNLFDHVKPGDYLSIQAFVDPERAGVVDPTTDVDTEIRMASTVLGRRSRMAATVGLGPRFLHSTGQLHKGGPPTGVFLQVVDGSPHGGVPGPSVPIPGKDYDFGTLMAAQAAGDFLTLRERGRRVERVSLEQLLEFAKSSQA
jgi:glucose-6-phosphate isomerase